MFRFTIRDLLWLTLVVALVLGWFVRECTWVRHEQRLQVELNDTQWDAYHLRLECELWRLKYPNQ